MNNTSVTAKPKFNIRQITLVGLMTAVLCILGPLALNIPFSPVPVSLGFLAVYFVSFVLGMKLGVLSIAAYIFLGLAGLPVFTNFMGGPGKLFGPTGGYIIGYIFMALICGFTAEKWGYKIIPCFLGMIFGTVIGYLFGTLWLAYQQSLTFVQALFAGVIPYIPFDLVKLVIAMAVGSQLRKRLLQAGLL